MSTLYLMVGLPGAGKTTRAIALARERGAVRLTPDEWMSPLFGVSDVDNRRDILEGRLIWTATHIISTGTDVILDFGLWGRDERAALHWLAATRNARAETVYLPIDPATQLRRVTRRWENTPHNTWQIDSDTLEQWRSIFQPPDDNERQGRFPTDHPDWTSWIQNRWPTAI